MEGREGGVTDALLKRVTTLCKETTKSKSFMGRWQFSDRKQENKTADIIQLEFIDTDASVLTLLLLFSHGSNHSLHLFTLLLSTDMRSKLVYKNEELNGELEKEVLELKLKYTTTTTTTTTITTTALDISLSRGRHKLTKCLTNIFNIQDKVIIQHIIIIILMDGCVVLPFS